MATYVFSAQIGAMIDKATGELMNDPDAPMATPSVVADTPGYTSPIDGSWIEGRRARRYDLEKNNCVDMGRPAAPPKLRNKRFAQKHNVEHLLDPEVAAK